ncbi:MAG: ATP-binding cassette domain-containing protein [Thermoguttaceae bacterium]|nr:ATP-binding cassette domain-containing protein [Thermoguttaceae bacterium]
MPLNKLYDEFSSWKLSPTEQKIAGDICNEILNRVKFLLDVGLDYLTLSRPATSLSGGEMQRIRLASQIGSGLCGALYVLDEPTIGLHPRDNVKLLNALRNLRDIGNTVLVVEHDKEIISGADDVLDFGPKAGDFGGELVAQGKPKTLADQERSVTGPYLVNQKSIAIPSNRRAIPGAELYSVGLDSVPAPAPKIRARKGQKTAEPNIALASDLGRWLHVYGVRQNNLKDVDVHIPVGAFTVVTGVSGSGKSSLVEDVLYCGMARILQRSTVQAGVYRNIVGIEHFNKVINVDQRPIGQTPLSNLATYTGVFDYIRNLFASLPEAKIKGFSARRFSFNAPGGRCEKCEGYGQIKVEMHFLPDVWVNCDACNGQRYEPETLSVKYHGFSIADVLNLSCKEALTLFSSQPPIRRILQTLCDVGLDYLALGQPAPTLSGGEAQRIKLASELSRPDTGRTLYVLDEPTTGLHFEDLAKLLEVLQRLVDLGNTVVVIEHNLDIVKTADWIIDLGPEAGEDGGKIVFAGTPENLAEYTKRQQKSGKGLVSYTGRALVPELESGTYVKREKFDRVEQPVPLPTEMEIERSIDFGAIGLDAKAPWETDGVKWHTQQRVARNGNACRWDGAILTHIVDYIDAKELLGIPDWGDRATVSVAAPKKPMFWFFRAITNEEWLLKLKVQVPRGVFTQEELDKQLDLKPLNDMPELPLYGAHSRVKIETAHDPRFQEIEMKVHYLREIDRPEFWAFIDKAINAFADELLDKPEPKDPSPAEENVTDAPKPEAQPDQQEEDKPKLNIISANAEPWKVLGRTWHLMPSKGFHKNRRPKWKAALLSAVVTWLEETFNDAEFGWTNKCVVPIKLAGRKAIWGRVSTKQTDAVRLDIEAEKNKYSVGELLSIGNNIELDDSKAKRDIVRIRFVTDADLNDAVKSFILKTTK